MFRTDPCADRYRENLDFDIILVIENNRRNMLWLNKFINQLNTKL